MAYPEEKCARNLQNTFESYIIGKTDEILERFKINKREQNEGESH